MPRMFLGQLFALCLAAGPALAGGFDLQRAIDAAQPGDTVRVPAGRWTGTFTVAKPIVLEGEPGAILDACGEGHVIVVTAPKTTIRGLTIRNTGATLDHEDAGVLVKAPEVTIEGNRLEDVLFGILMKGAEHGVIRDNEIGGKAIDIAKRGDAIRLWQASGTLIEGNRVRGSRDVVVWYSSDVTLRGNTVRECRYGMHFMFTDANTLEGNRLEDNSVGAFLMYSKGLVVRGNVFARNRGPSGYGLGLKDMSGIVCEDNLFLANRMGAYIDNSPNEIGTYDDFRRNVFAANEVGVGCLPNVTRNRFTENAFVENLEQVAVVGTGALKGNEFAVDGRGNYWSDYAGFDLGGDGIGDVAYRCESLFENLMDREPALRLFLHSPAQQAIELAARAFPAVKPEARASDPAPLLALPATDAPLAERADVAGVWLAAASLAGLAAGLVLFARRPFAPSATTGGVS